LVETATRTFYNDLSMPLLPPEVRRLMAIEHVGPRTAIRLYEELNIDSPEKLWWAAQHHRIRNLTGFGTKSESRLQEAAAQMSKHSTTTPLDGAA